MYSIAFGGSWLVGVMDAALHGRARLQRVEVLLRPHAEQPLLALVVRQLDPRMADIAEDIAQRFFASRSTAIVSVHCVRVLAPGHLPRSRPTLPGGRALSLRRASICCGSSPRPTVATREHVAVGALARDRRGAPRLVQVPPQPQRPATQRCSSVASESAGGRWRGASPLRTSRETGARAGDEGPARRRGTRWAWAIRVIGRPIIRPARQASTRARRWTMEVPARRPWTRGVAAPAGRRLRASRA